MRRFTMTLLVVAVVGCGAAPRGDATASDGSGGVIGVVPGSETTVLTTPPTGPAGTATIGQPSGEACPADEVCEIEVPLTEFSLEMDGASLSIDGGVARVVSSDPGAIVELDIESGEVTSSIEVPTGAIDLAVGADAWWVVVNEYGTGSLVEIDPATGHIVSETDFGGSAGPRSVALTDGVVWSVVDGYGRVGMLDMTTGDAVVIPADSEFAGGAVETPILAAHGWIWAVDASTGSVVRIDPASAEVIDVVGDLGYSATEGESTTSIHSRGPLALTATDDAVWVLSEGAFEETGSRFARGVLYEIDPTSGTQVQRIDLLVAPGFARPGVVVVDDAAWFVGSTDGGLVRVDLETGGHRMVRTPGFGALVSGLAAGDGVVWFVTEGGFGEPGGLFRIDLEEARAAASP